MKMIKASITKKNIVKIVLYAIGLFGAAIAYNSIFVPNNIIVGGASGLAIVLKEITGISTTILIDIMNLLLIVISFIFLGKKGTLKQILGCICYPIMVTITSPLSNIIVIDDLVLKFLFGALLYGVSLGLIYRIGFSTGGFDIISQILSNITKKPITAISPVINSIVLLTGYIVFSPIQILYSLIIIFVSNKIINIVLFSISNNKMVYILSNADVTSYITNNFHLGVTEFKVNSDLAGRKKNAFLVIVHNAKYDNFKRNILNLDPKATLIAKRCYEVTGGSRFRLLPF